MAKIIPFPGVSSDDEFDEALPNQRDPQQELHRELELSVQLSPEDCEEIPILQIVAKLLTWLRNEKKIVLTEAGYLPPHIVSICIDGLYLNESSSADHRREARCPELITARKLAIAGGIIVQKARSLTLSERGKDLAEGLEMIDREPGAIACNELYEALISSYLRDPDTVAQSSSESEQQGACVSRSCSAFLAALPALAGTLVYEEDFVYLQAQFDSEELEALLAGDTGLPLFRLEQELVNRFLRGFAIPFGLCVPAPSVELGLPGEEDQKSPLHASQRRHGGPWLVHERVRRVLSFDQAPSAVLQDTDAALMLCDLAVGAQASLYTARYAARAVERYPACAEAYLVLAAAYDNRPAYALALIQAGVQNCAAKAVQGQVRRLRRVAADLLVTLQRYDEAIAEYSLLLEEDGEDPMSIRYTLVPLLIQQGHIQRAEQLLEHYAQHEDDIDSAFLHWNMVLLSYAQGQRRLAAVLLAEALERNGYVADELLYPEPLPDIVPDSYYIGSPEEAILYVEDANLAWRAVKGARAWLRRMVESGE